MTRGDVLRQLRDALERRRFALICREIWDDAEAWLLRASSEIPPGILPPNGIDSSAPPLTVADLEATRELFRASPQPSLEVAAIMRRIELQAAAMRREPGDVLELRELGGDWFLVNVTEAGRELGRLVRDGWSIDRRFRA